MKIRASIRSTNIYLWECFSPYHAGAYERWMELDFEWLDCCQALIRLPGDSAGADREIDYAHSHGIPVFHSLENFLSWASTHAGRYV